MSKLFVEDLLRNSKNVAFMTHGINLCLDLVRKNRIFQIRYQTKNSPVQQITRLSGQLRNNSNNFPALRAANLGQERLDEVRTRGLVTNADDVNWNCFGVRKCNGGRNKD
jgi:hypothetical protein